MKKYKMQASVMVNTKVRHLNKYINISPNWFSCHISSICNFLQYNGFKKKTFLWEFLYDIMKSPPVHLYQQVIKILSRWSS